VFDTRVQTDLAEALGARLAALKASGGVTLFGLDSNMHMFFLFTSVCVEPYA
jgi:hypothetical protein